jgi:hypothetical protein
VVEFNRRRFFPERRRRPPLRWVLWALMALLFIVFAMFIKFFR